jgi:hypothetical protein
MMPGLAGVFMPIARIGTNARKKGRNSQHLTK